MARDGLFWWVVLVTTISLGAGLEMRDQVLQPGNHIVSENANRVKQVLESHGRMVKTVSLSSDLESACTLQMKLCKTRPRQKSSAI